jgi:hypothetical protein
MFKSMDKVLTENRKLDLEFEMMMASRQNYSEIFPSADNLNLFQSQDNKGAQTEQESDSKFSLASGAESKQMTKSQWRELLVQMISRGHGGGYECAICMSDIIPGNRRVVLLSCCHLYHQRCILNLENFLKAEEVSDETVRPPLSSSLFVPRRRAVRCADVDMKRNCLGELCKTLTMATTTAN